MNTPSRKLGSPHQLVILHKMFPHATEWGWERGGKACPLGPLGQCVEAWPGSRPICLGTSGVPNLSERDMGHLSQCLSVEKVPQSSPFQVLKEKKKAINDILSSLKGQLHQLVYPVTDRETWGLMDECLSGPTGIDSYEETPLENQGSSPKGATDCQSAQKWH